MSNLLFVHGRGQLGKDPAEIRATWVTALAGGLGSTPAHPAVHAAALPYYAEALDRWVRQQPVAAVARGEATGDQLDSFDEEFLRQLRAAAGVTDDQVRAELETAVVARGPEQWEWVQAIARAIDRRLPWLGDGVLQFIADVKTYLTIPQAHEEVHAIVRATIEPAVTRGEPVVVLGHSLGSVVAYRLLHEIGAIATVPLFVTLGSPLGINVVRNRVKPPALGRPEPVASWLNVVDERDYVALHSDLTQAGFPGVSRHLPVRNPTTSPHSIAGYLAHHEVAQHINTALGPA